VYKVIIEAMDALPMPIFPSFSTSVSTAEALTRYRAAGKCHFEDEVSMARAIGRMVNRPRLASPTPDPINYDGDTAARLITGVEGIVPPDLAQKVLLAAGIPVPKELLVKTWEDLAELASLLPPPWVMKVVGPLHKSDLGGVVTNVTATNVEETFNFLIKIKGAQGVLVQETVQGPEAIMGLSHEGDFGHLVAFGLGGLLAEALRDVNFGLCPLYAEEARRMVRSIRALSALQDYRGRSGMNLDTVADILVRVSLLGRDIPGIKEMDINPLKGFGKNLAAVDVRIIME
jgi:acetyltransferase